jgi:hypothetical protein
VTTTTLNNNNNNNLNNNNNNNNCNNTTTTPHGLHISNQSKPITWSLKNGQVASPWLMRASVRLTTP